MERKKKKVTIKDYVPPSQMKETGTDLDFVMSGVKHTNITWWRNKAVNWGLPRAEGDLRAEARRLRRSRQGEQVDRQFRGSSKWEGVEWGGTEDAG